MLPAPLRLRQLLDPAAAHATAGVHRSRLLGEGSDFAELRLWQPGDRARDLNWAASARRGRPFVNRHHPERAGEVVIMIDTFNDRFGQLSNYGREALARCASATWSLAQAHLRAQDRVGFLTQGRIGMWLPTDGGDRARYKLLDALLVLGTQAATGAGSWAINPQRVIRPAALVVAFTPLWDMRIVYVLHQLKRAGRKVVAVVIDVSDLLPATDDHHQVAARRLWRLALDDRRAQLAASGVPTVFWPSQSAIGPVIARAARIERKIGR